MDPLLDEKILLTISRAVPEIFDSTLQVTAIREAYGPSRNEGLCYEKCSSIELAGEFDGKYYMGLDGYTKTKLLPYIARSFRMDSFAQISSALVFMEFINLIAGHMANELTSAGFELEISPPNSLDNKLVPINLEEYRQYIIVYFLQDTRAKKYLGRIYTILTLRKFDQSTFERITDQPPIQPDWALDVPEPFLIE